MKPLTVENVIELAEEIFEPFDSESEGYLDKCDDLDSFRNAMYERFGART